MTQPPKIYQPGKGINWGEIDKVFLDMDGTLLDLNFDN